MRIGLMLRALHEKGGVGVYTRYITRELLALDQKNEYFLYYMGESHLGSHDQYPNATERALSGSNKALWDQVMVPAACRKDRIDVLFHPKFTVPLFAPCKTVMVLHGAGWFIPEHAHYWSSFDRAYLNVVMPLYCRRATRILSVSNVTTDVFNRRFDLPEGKARTVYLAPGRHFRRVQEQNVLDEVRERYGLPDRFILTLSKYPGGDRKNIDGILNAYRAIHGKTGHKLVVAGRDCDRFRVDYELPEEGYGADIVFPGYVDQADLPAVYTMASLFLYPSMMEAFPIPITEAMACGTPIVTSDRNGLREIAGQAAILVDSEDANAIAGASLDVLTNATLSATLGERGLQRSTLYTWDRCASQTLEAIENC